MSPEISISSEKAEGLHPDYLKRIRVLGFELRRALTNEKITFKYGPVYFDETSSGEPVVILTTFVELYDKHERLTRKWYLLELDQQGRLVGDR